MKKKLKKESVGEAEKATVEETREGGWIRSYKVNRFKPRERTRDESQEGAMEEATAGAGKVK